MSPGTRGLRCCAAAGILHDLGHVLPVDYSAAVNKAGGSGLALPAERVEPEENWD
jgi:hypothetical protein